MDLEVSLWDTRIIFAQIYTAIRSGVDDGYSFLVHRDLAPGFSDGQGTEKVANRCNRW